MKKAAAVTGAFIMLAGCSTADISPTAEDEVTITYARGVDTTNATDATIKAFEEEHPNINVEVREMPPDTGEQHNQYATILSSGSDEIDVFAADVVWPAEFAQAGYALPLDRLIERDNVDIDAHFPATIESTSYNGRQFAMPAYTDAGLLFYRKDIVDEPPETWEELETMAADLQGEEGTSFGYAMQASQYEGLVTNAIEYIGAYGGQIINENQEVVVNSPEAIEGIQKMIDVTQSDFVPNNILNFQEIETENAFINGNTVFARNWPYLLSTSTDPEISNIPDNVGFTTLPSGSDGTASALGGWTTMINKNSEEVEASWEFVKFMSSEQGQKIGALEGSRAPTIESLYDDEDIQEANALFADDAFVETLQNAVPRPVTADYPEVSDIMQIELSRAAAGEITAEEAAANLERKLSAVLNEE
ncbi:ABC transporter substrate-binding protein [Marinococcus halotolerans]|uniref:ABC transporter substrate-binding protein n=1 Tax=Marinococcus halotolerans TaxID=301092 RepID=UPI0003B3243E|nr:ABC transporter substrate-binding protein [Marinococcus halotolerans]